MTRRVRVAGPCAKDVVTLIVTSTGDGYDENSVLKLRRALPRLESLQLVDVSFAEIHLTPALTPNVKKLRMQNIGDSCVLNVVLPKLREVTIHYFRPEDCEWTEWGASARIDAMLAAATKLRSFDAYKLWVGFLAS